MKFAQLCLTIGLCQHKIRITGRELLKWNGKERTKAHSAVGDEFIYNWTMSAVEENQVLVPVNTQRFQWNTPGSH